MLDVLGQWGKPQPYAAVFCACSPSDSGAPPYTSSLRMLSAGTLTAESQTVFVTDLPFCFQPLPQKLGPGISILGMMLQGSCCGDLVSDSASLDIRTGSCVALPMATPSGCFQAVLCCGTSAAVAWLVVRSAVLWDPGRTPGGPPVVSPWVFLPSCGAASWAARVLGVLAVPGTTSPLDTVAVGLRGAVGAASWAALGGGVDDVAAGLPLLLGLRGAVGATSWAAPGRGLDDVAAGPPSRADVLVGLYFASPWTLRCLRRLRGLLWLSWDSLRRGPRRVSGLVGLGLSAPLVSSLLVPCFFALSVS